MKFHKTRSTSGESKIEIQMTPMLDMIFQLLVFFILTFRPVIDEGQFAVNMSSLAGGNVALPTIVPGMSETDEEMPEDIQFNPPFRIRLIAGPGGGLAPGGIIMGQDRRLTDVGHLEYELKSTVRGFAEDFEVIIEPDPNLHYEHMVQAVNAIYHAGVRKINFATPAAAQPGAG